MRKIIKTMPYGDVKFRWISDHYDVHLKGSCTYIGSLHEFENDYASGDEIMMVRIYKLDFFRKLKWIWKQWKFEKCIGYHFSYNGRKAGKRFKYRKPVWLYKRLYNWYYNL